MPSVLEGWRMPISLWQWSKHFVVGNSEVNSSNHISGLFLSLELQGRPLIKACNDRTTLLVNSAIRNCKAKTEDDISKWGAICWLEEVVLKFESRGTEESLVVVDQGHKSRRFWQLLAVRGRVSYEVVQSRSSLSKVTVTVILPGGEKTVNLPGHKTNRKALNAEVIFDGYITD